MKTNDRQITDLLSAVDVGSTQLPDFQRGWVWDDNRIKALIASVVHGFPVGAAMFLEYSSENIRFRYRPIEGASCTGQNVIPNELVLDGQQRLTSLYSALFSDKPVKTRTEKGEEILRYYYIDIEKSLDPNADDDEIILSVPESRIITSNFGRKIELDLSSSDKEYREKKFPLNSILDFSKVMIWQNGYQAYYNYSAQESRLFLRFSTDIVTAMQKYVMPVICLDKQTPKEAVCRVFENVNTGGISLTVFELVTAVFAMEDFELRKDWEKRRKQYFSGSILRVLTATDFLTALTLMAAYKRKGTVSCKKKDVLSLSLKDYKDNCDSLTEGFVEAEKLLEEERIFSSRDLPYSTQLIPLAALCAVLKDGNRLYTTNVKLKLKQWYWCGVFGELYGSANETRYANDMVQVMEWIDDDKKTPKTCNESYFNPLRLLSMQSRQSAAYKGVMALILKNHSKDFISGQEIDFTVYNSDAVDIHHIFPRDYCEKKGLSRQKWNSIVNKTAISYRTNRTIGGAAPSVYLETLVKKNLVPSATLDSYLDTHWIDAALCRTDDFDSFLVDRAKKLLNAIEVATGKTISGRDSDEVTAAYGAALI